MPNGARLWWVQHGSPQGVPQETAACTWPCETGRRCTSSGGIIVDSGSTVGENQQEAETVFSQSDCTGTGTGTGGSSSSSFNPGTGSSGSSSGTGGSSGSSGSGATFLSGGTTGGGVDGKFI